MIDPGLLSWIQLLSLASAAAIGGTLFGMTGFAYGVIASLFLHHVYPTADVILIVVSGGVVLNLFALPRFAREIDLRLAGPFLLGATLGLPVGVYILTLLPGQVVRVAVGLLIIVYCLLALRQQRQASLSLPIGLAGRVDAFVGLAGGVVGGVSGLGPLIPGVWYGVRGFSKMQQRGLALAYGLYVQGGMILWMVFSSTAGPLAHTSIALAAPILLLASWFGTRLFHRFSARTFQLIVVTVCLVGAVVLVIRQVV